MKKMIMLVLICVFALVVTGCGTKKNEIVVKYAGGSLVYWDCEPNEEGIVELESSKSVALDNKEGGVMEMHYVYKGLKEGKTVISCKNVNHGTGEVFDTEDYGVEVDKNLNVKIELQLDTK